MSTCKPTKAKVRCRPPVMAKKISYPLRGRYGISGTLTPKKPGEWALRSKGAYVRFAGEPENLLFVDLEGGPYIEVGADLGRFHPQLPETEVVKIALVKGKGITIYTKHEEATVPAPAAGP